MNKIDANITMFADGFIDEVWEIVDTRTGLSDYTAYSQMRKFSERIANSGSGGVGLEIVRKRRTYGGFTSNTGTATGKLGVDTALVGGYGSTEIDPVYRELDKRCRLYPFGNPCVTHIFEFDDGKVMMTYLETMNDVSWKHIVDKLGVDTIKSLLQKSSIVCVGYWSLLPAFDEIVSGICENMPDDGITRRFFFDFADILKRDRSALVNTIDVLRDINESFPVTLSVNEHESSALFSLLSEAPDNTEQSIKDAIRRTQQYMGFDEFVVHTPLYAAAALASGECAYIKQKYCENPVRTAGAGDTFNAGYITASLAGLNISERLYTANTAVSFFLCEGTAPDQDSLMAHMQSMES